MTTVKARCPSCGDIVTTTANVCVVLDLTTSDATFSVNCPQCLRVFTDHIARKDRDLANQLIRGGCRYSTL